jgi:hypothetical protein
MLLDCAASRNRMIIHRKGFRTKGSRPNRGIIPVYVGERSSVVCLTHYATRRNVAGSNFSHVYGCIEQ